MASHPDFDRYKAFFQEKRYQEALATLENLQAAFPQSAALYWHRANCLEQLELHTEVPAALDRFLELQPDYTPAIIKRVEYSACALDAVAPQTEDDNESALSARREAERAIRKRNLLDLRRVLSREPEHALAAYLLADLLFDESHVTQGSEATLLLTEAHQHLNRAIELAPERLDYRVARAERARSDAFVPTDDKQAADTPLVRTFSGMCYRQNLLEAALPDYEFCWRQSGEVRYAVKLAGLLHDLGRYDEALGYYDQALARLPDDQADRAAYIRELRARSENNGAGEREQMAHMILGGLNDGKDGKPAQDRTHAEDMAAKAMLGTAEAIRRGHSMEEAVAANLSDDPDTMMAINIAQNILSVANEPPPELEVADPANYPRYQRQHCDAVARAAAKTGLIRVADAEARGMFNMLGQHVLIRIFRNASGDTGLAAFSMKPKWPGVLVFLVLLLTGKWKAHRMVECVTQFDDGGLVSTQPASISPFQFGGKVRVHKMPPRSTVEEIVRQHAANVAAYRAEAPQAKPLLVNDLAGVEARWIAGQKAKAEYRRSIGYITDTELKAMLGSHYERFAGKVKERLQLLTK